MKDVITGGGGFLGSNIASKLLRQGRETFIFDNLYRLDSTQILAWLQSQGSFTFIHANIRNTNDVKRTIKAYEPGVIFHLTGQVGMTNSIADPRLDFKSMPEAVSIC